MKKIEKTEVDNLVRKVSEVIETHFSKEDKFVFEVNYENYQKFKHIRDLCSPNGFISNKCIGDTLSWGFWYSHIPEGYKLITFEEFAQRFIKEPLKLPDIVKYENNLDYGFKDGDIVKVLRTKNVYYYNSKAIGTLFRIDLSDYALKEWKNGENYSVDPINFHGVNYYPEDLVKATDEEVKYFNKLSEAIKRYPVGTFYYPIHPTSKKQGDACISNGMFCVTACGNIINTNDMYVYNKTIDKWAGSKPTPEIFINAYKGEFFPNYVKFGCAQIDKDLFKELVLNGYLDRWGNSNRSIESITIGKGIFSKSQIEQIVDYYDSL